MDENFVVITSSFVSVARGTYDLKHTISEGSYQELDHTYLVKRRYSDSPVNYWDLGEIDGPGPKDRQD